jgi:hypothetical protein
MCRGSTQSGKKCKRKTEPFCYQHLPASLKPELPFDTTNCTKKIIKKIEKCLAKPPSESDGPGYIYAYTIDADPPHFYKIGRTARTPEKRVKEWGKGAKLRAWWKVDHQKKTERLIHLYLDYVRVYRYQLDNGKICSIWKDDGEPVTDKDEKLKRKHKLTARTKQIEWFRVPWKDAKKVLNTLCE